MEFPWSPALNTPGHVFSVIRELQATTLPIQLQKEVLIDWCKEVKYLTTVDLYKLLRKEITSKEYKNAVNQNRDFWLWFVELSEEDHHAWNFED